MRRFSSRRDLGQGVRCLLFIIGCLLFPGCDDAGGADAATDVDARVDADVRTNVDVDVDADDVTEPDASTKDADALDGNHVDADTDVPDTDSLDEPDIDGPVVEGPPFLRLTLDDGREIGGEHVATYDHRLWWDASDQLTYALFDPELYGEYPDDRSLSFTSSFVVVSLLEETLPPEVMPYGELLRDRGVVIEMSPLEGVTLMITGHEGYHLEENGFGDFAFDFVRTDAAGQRFTDDGLQNEEHLIWDNVVTLPTDGFVVEVIRDAPDNEPGSYPDGAVNNMVGVHLHGSFYLYLLHFRQDTIVDDVEVGVTLTRGHYLGRVGNAGVSLEPHLHMALLWYDESMAEPRSWSVPVEFAGIHAAPTATGPSAFEAYAAPLGGTWISDEAF